MNRKAITDEDQQQKADKEQALRRLTELEDIRWLLNTQQGHRFFKRLFTEGRVFQTTFTGNSNTFFLEGHRNLALRFFGDVVEACPERIASLMITPPAPPDSEKMNP
jgi:hypothetical protein